MIYSLNCSVVAKQPARAFASPFLKWAGGKRSILPEIRIHLPEQFNDYYEPFLGGGAVFFDLYPHLTGHAYLSDINQDLITTYQVVQTQPDALIEQLQHHQRCHSAEYYKQLRDQFVSWDDRIMVAARFIYLNRTCFNGLYRVNSKGRFNVPIGQYSHPAICNEANLRKVAKALSCARLSHQDFEKLSPQKGDFIYCDPPYCGTFANYSANGFDDEAQERLKIAADGWLARGAYVMLSNSNMQLIRNLYKNYRVIEVSAPRVINCKANNRDHTTELLMMGY